MANLRRQLYRGGGWLGAREVAGIAIRTLGLLVLVRLLGPAGYGSYAGALALVVVLTFMAQLGVETHLNRRRDAFSDHDFDVATGFLLASSAVTVTLGLALSVAAAGVLEDGMDVAILQVLILAIPINVLWAPAVARLDKQVRFRDVAALELSGDVLLHGVSIAAVLAGLDAWGPVVGYFTWQVWLLVGSHVRAGHLPRPRIDRAEWRRMLRFGRSFAAAQWLRAGEAVVNPLLVGPAAGTAGVGIVALGLRIMETLGFVIRTGVRIAVVAFSAAHDDRGRLRRTVEEAALVQVMGLGALLAAVGIGIELLVGVVFGSDWDGVSDLYPWLALAFLASAAFSAQSVLLQMRGRGWSVVAMNALKLGLVAAGTALLVPSLGIDGFGVASALATGAYLITHMETRREVGYRLAPVLPWLAAFGALLFLPHVPAAWIPVTLLPLALAAALARAPVLEVASRVRTAQTAPPL